MANGLRAVIDVDGLDEVITRLRVQGFSTIGPTCRDGAIVYDEIEATGELPRGWADDQDAGTYRLVRRDDEALFGYAVGPHSWKQYLHPPGELLFEARRDGGGFVIEERPEPKSRHAFIGVRACELAAIGVQDRVLVESEHPAGGYSVRRGEAFLLAVDCGEPGGSCFCVSMGTGPGVSSGFDLALTELMSGEHRFLVRVGSDAGAAVLGEVASREATGEDLAEARRVVEMAGARMGRHLDTDGLPVLLAENLEHPRWDDVARRCLTCTNCTLVCPTCFCSTVEDLTTLDGQRAQRWQRWDSCFTLGFSELHGSPVRHSTRGRYRQWLTHKLGTWWEQFGESGCVGCGRCITWCPVGIDMTAEVAALRRLGVDASANPEEVR